MMYVVKKGYSYIDIKGRNKVYTGGEHFDGVVDPSQQWKLGTLTKESPQEIATKVMKRSNIKNPKDDPDYDPDDEGEETE